MTPIVVVGAPGSGKTTVGREVARRLGVRFVDVDERIEHLAGKPITDIFADDGEAHFRAMEVDQTLTALGEHAVVSLGGGAVMSPRIREALRGHTVVWLRVSAAQAGRRVGLNASRPLLWGDMRARLKGLLAERLPLYEEVATLSVETDHVAPDDVAAAVLAALEEGPA